VLGYKKYQLLCVQIDRVTGEMYTFAVHSKEFSDLVVKAKRVVTKIIWQKKVDDENDPSADSMRVFLENVLL